MIRAFLDASVLFAAAYSATGAARDLILLGEAGKVSLIASDDVLTEVRRNLENKVPHKLHALVELIEPALSEIVTNLTRDEVLEAAQYTALKDAPIVAAAAKSEALFLVTYDHKHLLEKPEVAEKSGLRIVTPDVVVALVLDDTDSDRE